METRATASTKVGWTLAGLAGMALFYALLLTALAGRVASLLPADVGGWFAAF